VVTCDTPAVRSERQTPPAPPLRADAQRNRQQIIEAARALFIRIGADVPMEEIARAAGVGVGTLYRRFPDRDELIKAVSLDSFRTLVDIARRVERDESDPATALTTLLYSTLDLQIGVTMTAVSARAYQAIQDSAEIAALRDEAIAVATRLLRRAQADGALRPDVGIGDVVLSVILVAKLAPPTGRAPGSEELGEMIFRRVIALMLDGLRASPGAALPGRPVDYDDIEDLRRNGGFTGFGKPAPGR
jgi:AcrR family transcriptional regulator